MTKQPYRPTWGNKRASICHWNLQFHFHTKEQCQKFIALLMQEELDYHFEYWYEMGDSTNPPKYWVSIDDHPWANSLVRVATLLKQVDYEMD